MPTNPGANTVVMIATSSILPLGQKPHRHEELSTPFVSGANIALHITSEASNINDTTICKRL
jgi:hypothetical protein